MMSRDPSLLRLPLLLLLFFAPCIFGQYDPFHQCNLCNNDKNFTTHQGAVQLLQNLKTNTSFPSYATASNDSLSLYALLQCGRDLPTADCDRCSTVAANRLTQNCSQQVLDLGSSSVDGYMCSRLPAVLVESKEILEKTVVASLSHCFLKWETFDDELKIFVR